MPKHRNIKKSLTIEDIGKILSVRLEPRSMREMSRDLWIFSYLSNGLNFADILNLKNADYDRKNKTIVFIRQKTSNAKTGSVSKIQIDLNPVTTSIIENWGNPAGEYVFPIFDATMSVARKKAVCAQVTKNTNYNMKVVATELEINTDVKTYAARHSFATILLRSEAPLAFISQKLGHSSIKTTQDYLGSFEDEKVKKYLSALIPESKEAQKEAEEG